MTPILLHNPDGESGPPKGSAAETLASDDPAFGIEAMRFRLYPKLDRDRGSGQIGSTYKLRKLPVKSPTPASKKTRIILLVHGIRTHAWWQGELRSLIEEKLDATVIPLKYGYFDVVRFWCPFGICRQGPIRRLHKDLREVINQFRDRDISIIAHSYGTYAISQILLEYEDIKLNSLVLCGSIIPASFPWARIKDQIKQTVMREAVLNECGTKDIWPVLATATTWGYGNSGTYGFGSPQVTDRTHAMPHSGYLNKEFASKFWLPFLKQGVIVVTAVERSGTGTPWWFSLLSVPWKWLVVVPFALLVVFGTFRYTVSTSAKQWACKNVTAIGGISACKDILVHDISINSSAASFGNTESNGGTGSGSVIAKGGVAAGGEIKANDTKIEVGQ